MEVRIRRLSIVLLFAFLFTVAPVGAQAPASPPSLPDAQQVISYLDQTIDWYRNLAIQEELATDPEDALFLNDNRHLAKQIAQLSFDFARADADYLSRHNIASNP